MNANQVTVLVRQASEGDSAAWEHLYAEYSRLLWGVARRFRLDEHQRADAVQATWLKLLENIDDIRDPACLPGWLATTVRRICSDKVRASQREKPVEVLGEWRVVHQRADDDDDTCPVRSLIRREHQAAVRLVLAELPEQQKQLLQLLHASPALSYQELSKLTGMPVGSIGPTRARILAKLRSALQAHGLVDGVCA
ncbi:sigma-70 family RNA polymerase sigma factor [Nocardioides cavernae]|uniref:Sigma-70 family RNA polymerase sigma factor n=1 Tax=Nocardioides cavernae TaxID=1921566 RepID=A0ABR8NH56_9ACTN|nr:sigma-70 family RNA polymerase sigma factor [Nocardioides cavernae]MBD3927458.1 sigma-70 family RNA polymerase sigma factor [Nocardioides cavernae]MBM7513221.1 RNA polymerase sigma factor (sigma-70 family) [Nocardioides cavernae]